MAPSASVEMLVTFLESCNPTPAAESKPSVHTCEPPSRELTKRNRLPSGDQWPPVSPAGSKVTCRESPPARGTTHRCEVRLLVFKSTSTAEKRTHLPSCEIAGPPMRLRASMSSKVKGCLSGCEADWAQIWLRLAMMNTISA